MGPHVGLHCAIKVEHCKAIQRAINTGSIFVLNMNDSTSDVLNALLIFYAALQARE